MHRIIRYSLCLLATLTGTLAHADRLGSSFSYTFPFKAEAGHYERKSLTEPAAEFTLKGTLLLRNAQATDRWAASAGIIIAEDEDLSESLQVNVLRYASKNSTAETAYRRMEGGKETQRYTQKPGDNGERIPFEINFKQGLITARLDGQPTVRFHVPFTTAIVLVMGVGGTGEIKLDYAGSTTPAKVETRAAPTSEPESVLGPEKAPA